MILNIEFILTDELMKSIGFNFLNLTKYEEMTISPQQLGQPNLPLELEYNSMLLYFSTIGKNYKKTYTLWFLTLKLL